MTNRQPRRRSFLFSAAASATSAAGVATVSRARGTHPDSEPE
jgi:hypothetical protein